MNTNTAQKNFDEHYIYTILNNIKQSFTSLTLI